MCGNLMPYIWQEVIQRHPGADDARRSLSDPSEYAYFFGRDFCVPDYAPG
jgi:hypothetical protein